MGQWIRVDGGENTEHFVNIIYGLSPCLSLPLFLCLHAIRLPRRQKSGRWDGHGHLRFAGNEQRDDDVKKNQLDRRANLKVKVDVDRR